MDVWLMHLNGFFSLHHYFHTSQKEVWNDHDGLGLDTIESSLFSTQYLIKLANNESFVYWLRPTWTPQEKCSLTLIFKDKCPPYMHMPKLAIHMVKLDWIPISIYHPSPSLSNIRHFGYRSIENNQSLNIPILHWLLLCTCYCPWYRWPRRVRPYILSTLGSPLDRMRWPQQNTWNSTILSTSSILRVWL